MKSPKYTASNNALSNDSIDIELSDSHFEPSEMVKGTIRWRLSQPPEKIIFHMGWYTEGRGSQDSCIEFEKEWDTAFDTGAEVFSCQLPHAPYSFSGKLIELNWYLSAETKKGRAYVRKTITLGPNKQSVQLK